MRIPSASFCQRSTILMSASSAALEQMKSNPELSPEPGVPPDGCDDSSRVDRVTVFGHYLFYIRL